MATISVRQLAGQPFKGIVRRDADVIGYVTKRGKEYHPEFLNSPGTHWFPTITSALRYIVTQVPDESGHLIVTERGDAIGQHNAPTIIPLKNIFESVTEARRIA